MKKFFFFDKNFSICFPAFYDFARIIDITTKFSAFIDIWQWISFCVISI